jgi:hypothetical protein
MNAYIEIVSAIGIYRHELTNSDLREIGEFARENISNWLASHTSPDWVGILPVSDFHAVCGDNSRLRDTDIPWATERGRLRWVEVAAVARKGHVWVVGQEVWMESGCYSLKGTVVKVTKSFVEVETGRALWGLMRFGTSGSKSELGGKGTYENGPWYIVDKSK